MKAKFMCAVNDKCTKTGFENGSVVCNYKISKFGTTIKGGCQKAFCEEHKADKTAVKICINCQDTFLKQQSKQSCKTCMIIGAIVFAIGLILFYIFVVSNQFDE